MGDSADKAVLRFWQSFDGTASGRTRQCQQAARSHKSELAAGKTLAPRSELHRREIKYHNMKITLSLARSDDGGRILKLVVVAAAALVVEPAVPRRLEAVEGPGRL